MGRHRVDVEARSSVGPEAVWRLLADATTWSSWGPWNDASLDREGSADRNGVGAIRRFRRGRVVTVEEVVAFEPPRHFGYVLLSGLPLRDYRAEVTLTEVDDGGTSIRWQASFKGAFPGIGMVLRPAFARFLRDVAQRLAAAAEQSPTGPTDRAAPEPAGS